MQSLPVKFSDRGFDFELCDRQGDVALLAKRKGDVLSYEVVIVQKRAAHTWPNGNTTPAHEAMPPSESWGKFGFTYPTKEPAQARLAKLVAENAPDA